MSIASAKETETPFEKFYRVFAYLTMPHNFVSLLAHAGSHSGQADGCGWLRTAAAHEAR